MHLLDERSVRLAVEELDHSRALDRDLEGRSVEERHQERRADGARRELRRALELLGDDRRGHQGQTEHPEPACVRDRRRELRVVAPPMPASWIGTRHPTHSVKRVA